MNIYLEEKIGNPDLFTGRKKELTYFLEWIDKIQKKISKSTAILSRRKTGKTALLQRLYNLTFHKHGHVIPFYFEIKETNQWLGDFCEKFFLTFVYQYLAFKTRRVEYLAASEAGSYHEVFDLAQQAELEFLASRTRSVQKLREENKIDLLWDAVRETPRNMAEYYNEYVVQLIDEFQFLNRFIFWDHEKLRQADDLAGSYLHTAEYKHAPLLVAGSWVGWLMDDVNRLLPGRFIYSPLENMPEEEAIEMIIKYAVIEEAPVSEETTYLIAQVAEGNPFYISALFQSRYPHKDLTTEEGVRRTLEYETLNLNGSINATWMEYIDSAFPRINEVYAKDIVLYLSKHRHKRVSRKELKEKLHLEMTDPELEKKFRALFRSDIIEEDYGSYRGVQDNIFDKVFRRSYAEDIDTFLIEEAPNEYKALFEDILEKYKKIQGEYNRYKGAFAEFVIIHHLSSNALKNQGLFTSLMHNLPEDFVFVEYESVLSYHSPPLYQPEFQIDIFAKAHSETYSLIGEVKNREAKFSVKDAEAFVQKAQALVRLEQIEQAMLFVFSAGGFYKNTLGYLAEHNMAWSEDPRWLDYHLLRC